MVYGSQLIENGWSAEMMIPFKSLRFGGKDRWGINPVRVDASNNANHSWAPVPIQFYGTDLGYLGQLVWDRAPVNEKRNISFVPYLLGDAHKDFETKVLSNKVLLLGWMPKNSP